MPVSLYGLPAITPDMVNKAAELGLPVIEDSAQCFLGKVGNRLAGSIGRIGSFSFQNSKHMTCGEGGIVVTNDSEAAGIMRRFSSLGYGQISAEPGKSKIDKNAIAAPGTIRHVDFGFNFRMSELCGAFALAQLEKLDIFVAERRKCAQAFLEIIDKCSFLKPQKTPAGIENSYWAVAVELDQAAITWHEFQKRLLANGGDGFYGAWRLAYQEPYFARLFPNIHCPVAEKLQRNMIQFKTHYCFDAEMPQQLAALKATIASV